MISIDVACRVLAVEASAKKRTEEPVRMPSQAGRVGSVSKKSR